MSTPHDDIRRYLATPDPGFWWWDRDGEAVLWCEGSVLAFRKEIVEVLEELSVEGLPQLSAVLLVMAAAKRNWETGQRAVQALSTLAGRFDDAGHTVPLSFLTDVMSGLHAVHKAREDLADDPYALANLPALILSDVERVVDASRAKDIVAALRAGPGQEILDPYDGAEPYDDFLRCLNVLRERLSEVSADALHTIAHTGLDRPVEPPPQEIELEAMPARARTLIEQLRNDEEYAAIARLTRALMAAIHLPRAVADPQHLPLGGVSDITNRGELDRLLISELAHDDMTLAVRIANNEALYLRREDPPSTPTRQRLILLDTGIRMWGVPRVLATSAALALLASCESNKAVVWSMQHGELVEANLGDRDGIIEHLSRLDASLTPVALLEPLIDRIADADAADESCADIVVITSSTTAADSDFIRQMRKLLPHELYLMGVHRDGEVSLASVTETGVRPMRQMQLELDEVMDVGIKRNRVIAREIDPALPAIFKVSPFPLRVGGRIDPRCVWRVADGPSLTLTRDGRLLLWENTARGPLMLRDDLNGFFLHWAGTLPWADTSALVGSLSSGRMAHLTIDLNENQAERVDLEVTSNHGEMRGATVHRDHALFFYRRVITAVDLQSGSVVDVHKTGSDIKEMHGRMIRLGRDNWSMVSFDGSICVEKVGPARRNVIGYIESRELDALVTLEETGDASVFNNVTGQWQILVNDNEWRWRQLMGVSRDGLRFALRRQRNGIDGTAVFSIASNQLHEVGKTVNDKAVALELPAWEKITDRSRRTKFDFAMILRADDGTVLLGLAGRHTRVVITHKNGGMNLEPSTHKGAPHPFELIASPPKLGYKLKTAEWPDGSRIVHDSRGLLHLQSSDTTIPEATIVLAADEPLSGWLSDGRCWGDYYYVQGVRVDSQVVYRTVIERFLRNLA